MSYLMQQWCEARSKNIIKLVEKKYKAVLIAPINENLPKYSNKLDKLV